MRCLHGITNTMNMNLSKLWEMLRDREAWHVAVYGITKRGHNRATEQQQRIKYSTLRALKI